MPACSDHTVLRSCDALLRGRRRLLLHRSEVPLGMPLRRRWCTCTITTSPMEGPALTRRICALTAQTRPASWGGKVHLPDLAGTAIPFSEFSIFRTASALCHYAASQTGGGEQLGDLWRLSNNEYLAYFPSFGGWCTGRSADTGVPRGIFSCPLCQFLVEGFE